MSLTHLIKKPSCALRAPTSGTPALLLSLEKLSRLLWVICFFMFFVPFPLVILRISRLSRSSAYLWNCHAMITLYDVGGGGSTGVIREPRHWPLLVISHHTASTREPPPPSQLAGAQHKQARTAETPNGKKPLTSTCILILPLSPESLPVNPEQSQIHA